MTELKSKLILLVEDHAPLRQMLAMSLESLGYQVTAAATGDEALALLEGELRPAMVLTDVRMPGRLNGLGLAQWIAANRPSIPVVLQTGFVSEPTNGYAVLRKPFSADELIAILDKTMACRAD